MITYQMVCCSFFFLFFSSWESNAYMCSHVRSTHRRTFVTDQKKRNTRGAFDPNVPWRQRGSASAQWFKHPAPGLRSGLLRADWHRAAPTPLYLFIRPASCLPFLQKQGRGGKWQNVSAERVVWHPQSFCSCCSSLMKLCWNVRPISSFPSDI